jgi:imidazolonepropionase-like amidohydrolase
VTSLTANASARAAIADNADTVRLRAREQLALGAAQIKLMAGGGVSSSRDPLDVTQYTVEEFHAAVEAAENWGTYVTVHAYTPRDVQKYLATDLTAAGLATIKDVAAKATRDAAPLKSSLAKLSEEFKALGVSMSPTAM